MSSIIQRAYFFHYSLLLTDFASFARYFVHCALAINDTAKLLLLGPYISAHIRRCMYVYINEYMKTGFNSISSIDFHCLIFSSFHVFRLTKEFCRNCVNVRCSFIWWCVKKGKIKSCHSPQCELRAWFSRKCDRNLDAREVFWHRMTMFAKSQKQTPSHSIEMCFRAGAGFHLSRWLQWTNVTYIQLSVCVFFQRQSCVNI